MTLFSSTLLKILHKKTMYQEQIRQQIDKHDFLIHMSRFRPVIS